MSTTSIDIPAMHDLIRTSESSAALILEQAAIISDRLLGLLLPADNPGLAQARQAAHWIREQIPDLNRRVALAEYIEAQTPGLQTSVDIDESRISDRTPQQAREDAQRALERLQALLDAEMQISGERRPMDPELLQLLTDNALDPYFAQELAKGLDPAMTGLLVQNRALDLRWAEQDGPEAVDASRAEYEAFIDAIGGSLGVASRGTGPLSPPEGFADSWAEALTLRYWDESYPSSQLSGAIALTLSRGAFGREFLETVHAKMFDIEAERPGASRVMAPYGITDPAGRSLDDPMLHLVAGLRFNPEAARSILSPSNTRRFEVAGEPAMSTYLQTLMMREWGEGGVDSLTGLLTDITTGDFANTAQTEAIVGESARVAGLAEALRQQAEADADMSVSDWIHLGLDFGGMLPVVGIPIDVGNGLWYAIEGDPLNAGMSMAGMIPFAGDAASAGRTGRRVKNVLGDGVESATSAARQADDIAGQVASGASRSADSVAGASVRWDRRPVAPQRPAGGYGTNSNPGYSDPRFAQTAQQPALDWYENVYPREYVNENGNRVLPKFADDRGRTRNRPPYLPGQREQVWVNSRNQQLEQMRNGEFPPPDSRGMETRIKRGHEREMLAEDEMYVLNTSNEYVITKFDRSGEWKWNMGHLPNQEYRRSKADYLDGDLTFPEFMHEQQGPNRYMVEEPGRNSSHLDEGRG
ncbi:hypothetical protein GCM10022261_22810 [Brevibacterium daeguense]|uniref:Toxin YqcG C-terminal domain-containing protein n=1 Tax=Brevibacterium daeguense TaxID=909936 RepID=A0ABP8EL93_9MICO|nr:GH-E family nuclease [Brevibacterium daeguense]